MRITLAPIALALLCSLQAHAQGALPGANQMCMQGQCAAGNYCDFAALPNPICRAIPAAAPPAPAPVVPAPVAPAPAPVPVYAPAPAPAPYPPVYVPPPPPEAAPPAAPPAPPPAPPPEPAPAPTSDPASDSFFRLGFDDGATPDHAMYMRHVGLGFFGRRDVPLLDLNAAANVPVEVGLLMLRFWYLDWLGFDVGIGAQHTGSSVEARAGSTSSKQELPSTIGALLHVGVPFAIVANKHVAMLVVPSLEVGFTNRTTVAPTDDDEDLYESGILLGAGVRAGAEIHLGFIGLPQIALESTIGASGAVELAAAATGNQSVTLSSSRLVLPAALTPLDLLLSQAAIRYYF